MSDATAPNAYPVIAIDGPTASGKGTVAHQVADLLGFHLLDSGSLYRLVALASMRENIDDHDVDSLVRVSSALDVRFKADHIWLQGEDVSLALRHESVGNQASAIAVHGPVRDALRARQRAFLAWWPTVVTWAR
jgi:cytidylate kinase